MARLTWQNVAAPDMSDALRGVDNAGRLFDAAASRFSGALGDIAGRGRRDASKRALEKALSFGDVGSWEQAIQNQGLGALGIRPDQATDELLDFVVNRRGQLADDRADDQIAARRDFDLSAAETRLGWDAEQQADDNRDRDFQFNVDQYGFGRTQLTDQRSDKAIADAAAKTAREAELRKRVQDVAGANYTREDARRSILNENLSPEEEALALGFLEETPEGYFQADEWAVDEVMSHPLVDLVGDGIDSRMRTYDQGVPEAVRIYSELAGSSKEGNGIRDVIERARAETDPNLRDEIFDDSSGTIMADFNRLQSEFPGVDPHWIAQVLEQSLTHNSRIWSGERKLTFDMDAARATLQTIATDTDRNKLEERRISYENGRDDILAMQRDYEQATSVAALALQNNDEEAFNSAVAKIEELLERAGVSPAAGATDPASQLLEEALATGFGSDRTKWRTGR